MIFFFLVSSIQSGIPHFTTGQTMAPLKQLERKCLATGKLLFIVFHLFNGFLFFCIIIWNDPCKLQFVSILTSVEWRLRTLVRSEQLIRISSAESEYVLYELSLCVRNEKKSHNQWSRASILCFGARNMNACHCGP